MNKTRRDNKSGSVPCKLKDGRWCSSIMIGRDPSTGKPKKKNIYGKTSAECKKKMKEYIKELNSKQIKITTKMKATDFFKHWFKDYKKGEIEDSSYDRLISCYENNILPFIERKQLSQITPDLIKYILNEANKKNLAPTSINKIFEVLRPALNVAVEEHLIENNPVKKVKMLSKAKINKKEKNIKIYDNEQIKELFSVIDKFFSDTTNKTYIHFPMFKFLANTGLRVSECIALQWSDIQKNDSGTFININKSFSRSAKRDENDNIIGRKTVLKTPKTQKGIRIVPLNAKALEALNQVKEINEKLNINCEYIFATRDNTHTTIGRVQRSFANLLKLANINENYGIHSLRHLFGSNLAHMPNINVKEISELMGHTDVSFTYNTYIHGDNVIKANAVNSLCDLY